jgi:hypothetical protein
VTLLVALVQAATSTSATADRDSAPRAAGKGRFGIRLLEAPVSRRHDPRARQYIVDHLPPGTTIHRRMQVENMSARPLHVDVYAGAAGIAKNRFTVAPGATPNELTTWISFDKKSLDLRPYSRIPVRVTVKVPPSASQAERYAAIWAQAAAPPDHLHNLGAINRIGIRVYLDIGAGGEPPSDFRIDALTPARTKDGRPEVLAQVRNTGGRALDISGSLTLADGPAGLKAGPFAATLGTTLAPGNTTPVTVVLDAHVPDGPWKARLTLASGMVHKTVAATLTFPQTAATTGMSIRLDSKDLLRNLILAGTPAVLAALLLFVIRRRRRSAAR